MPLPPLLMPFTTKIFSEKETSSWLSALPITEHGIGLNYTTELSGMPSASATVGDYQTYPLTVFVESASQLSMRLAVPEEVFHRYAIMKFEI